MVLLNNYGGNYFSLELIGRNFSVNLIYIDLTSQTAAFNVKC